VSYDNPKGSSMSPALPASFGPAGGPRGEEDELDPELVALPRPARQGRTLTLLVLMVAAAAAVAMAVALRGEVTYALSSPVPVSLGDLRTTPAETLAANQNRLVRAEGMLGVAGGIRYERLLVDDTFRTLPVAGRSDVWVDLRVTEGQENGRWEPPGALTGRLVRFSAAGPRHRGLESAIEQSTHAPVPAGAWLLVDGEEPEGARWAIVLAGLFVACALWNVVAIGRIVRKVR
jgi:hypothetical protein